MTTINIDFDKILDVAQLGVRRASVFMGLGVNASLDQRISDYQLTKITNIQLVPSTVTQESLGHFKDEFRIWIEANGFRELVETFAVFLERVHVVCMIIKANKGGITNEDKDKNIKIYQRMGISDKLKILSDDFQVAPSRPSCIISLNKARNCLTHRRGVVGIEDLNSKQELQVEWTGLDIFAETPDSERIMLLDIPPDGILLKHGGTVKAQFITRSKVFHLNELLRLSTRDIAEICWMFSLEAKETARTAIQYSRNMGITVLKTTK